MIVSEIHQTCSPFDEIAQLRELFPSFDGEMLRIQLLQVRSISDLGFPPDHQWNPIQCSLTRAINRRFQSPLTLQFIRRRKSSHSGYSHCIFGKSPRGDSGDLRDNRDDEFLEAVVLTPETLRHYHLRKHGFLEETKWQHSSPLAAFSVQAKGPPASFSSIGHGFLRQFHSPTIFLKVSCDGDLLLPIIVGEFAIEKLIQVLSKEEDDECPEQYQFVKNLVEMLGYEVKMVRITDRVVNTYYARIYIGKPGEKSIISMEARPSDAINVAKRCKAPIYVSKQIVLADAVRLVYGRWRGHGVKSIYDVSLDSAPEGPDSLSEELDLLKKMNIAVKEERYKDAAMLREKLSKLRMYGREL